jgi:hypothetical protein
VTTTPTTSLGVQGALAHPFLDALATRTSRRVGLGMSVPWDPVGYDSPYTPVPLCEIEEAILVASAVGTTGAVSADLGHPDGLAALVNWTSRSFPSPCNNQGTRLFVTNDTGTWIVDAGALEPPTVPPASTEEHIAMVCDRHRRAMVRLGDARAELPTGPPGLFGFNAWNANQPGTTLFVPVTDMTTEYLNVLLVYLGSEQRVTIVDDREGGRPAGLDRWVRSGRLDGSRTMGIVAFEQRLLGIMATEAAFICQNLALAQQCLGLGGFTFSAYHSHWSLGGMDVPGLGFRFAQTPAGERFPVGLDGMMETYTPTYHGDMSRAVSAFLDRKLANRLRDGADTIRAAEGHRPGEVLCEVSWPDEETVEMVTAYCQYVIDRYGRFPAHLDPVFSRIVSQAHHVDPDYYAGQPGAGSLPVQHVEHFRRWHPDLADTDGRPPRR